MKRLIIIFIFSGWILSITAQYTFVKQWDYRFGGTQADILSYVQQTKDSGYIMGGSSTSVISGDKTQANWDTTLDKYDYWIVKTDASGNKEWDKRFGGVLQDNFWRLDLTTDGGYILGGESSSNADGDKTEGCRGGFDYWLVKIDAAGNKEWDKRFGGNSNDYLYAIQQTLDKGYIMGGWTGSSIGGDKTQANWGDDDYWVVKIDSAGHKQWDKRYGGTRADHFHDLLQSRDGGYLLGGISMSDSSGDKSQDNWVSWNYNMWVIKIDTAGNKIWDKKFGGLSEDYLSVIRQTPDNGFILGSYGFSNIGGDKTQNSKGERDFWMVKIDSVGNKQWDKDFGALGDEVLCSLELTNDGGYLLTGSSYTMAADGDKSEPNLGVVQAWLVKTDSDGNKEWDKTIFINGTETVTNAFQTVDGCYMVGTFTPAEIGGYKTQASWDSSADYWILKFCMDTVVGIDDRQQTADGRQIQVWPNPFSSDLSIALKGENIHEATFTITNALGQVIYKREENNLSSSYTKMLDLSYLPGGFYFITVTQNGEVFTRKVVKE